MAKSPSDHAVQALNVRLATWLESQESSGLDQIQRLNLVADMSRHGTGESKVVYLQSVVVLLQTFEGPVSKAILAEATSLLGCLTNALRRIKA